MSEKSHSADNGNDVVFSCSGKSNTGNKNNYFDKTMNVTDTGKEYKELYIFYCAIDMKEPGLVGVYAIVIEGADGTKCSIKLPQD